MTQKHYFPPNNQLYMHQFNPMYNKGMQPVFEKDLNSSSFQNNDSYKFKSDAGKTSRENIELFKQNRMNHISSDLIQRNPSQNQVFLEDKSNIAGIGVDLNNFIANNKEHPQISTEVKSTTKLNNELKETKAEVKKEEAIKNEDLVKAEDDYDSDRELFKEENKEAEKEKSHHDADEILSEDSKESEKETETKDILLAQYDKVHRVRNKWKCSFKDAILNINGKEYIFDKVTGELERDW